MNRLSKSIFVVFCFCCFQSVFAYTTSTAIAAGSSQNMCALTSVGDVMCWGYNTFGQDGSGLIVSIPVKVTGWGSGVSAIGVGYGHTCALTNSGGVECLGWNAYGQLGNDMITNSSIPVNVVGLSSGVSAIAVGYAHTCALTNSGGVVCWGWNAYGQLGNGANANSAIPVSVTGLSSGVTAIAAGTFHTCALTSSGGVKCWGDNTEGELGNGTTGASLTPTNVTGLSSGVIAIATGGYSTCALTNVGAVECWGDNSHGELGNGTTTQSTIPVSVTGLDSGVIAIAVGGVDQACALTSAGGVECWGNNLDGELGNGTTTDSTTPVNVTGLSSGVTAITAGSWHTCALTSAGGVECWGENDGGELGNGTLSNSSTPVNVLLPPLQVITVSAPAPSGAEYGSNFTVTASASSGLPVSITASGGCSGSGSGSAIVTMASNGSASCTVYYNQPGDGINYAAAAQVSSVTVPKQTITVTTPAPVSAAYNSSFTVAATASSGLPVSITASGGCSGSGSGSATLIMASSGSASCTVYYNQPGDGVNYVAAAQVINVTLQVGSTPQTITVTLAAPASAYNTDFHVSAVSSSGLPVTITASGGCVVTLSNPNSASILMNSGTTACTVYYDQAGDANYAPATQVRSVTLVSQTISYNNIPYADYYNSNFSVWATSSSGLPVAITSSGGCSGAGSSSGSTSTVTITMTSGTTSCTVYYNQPGDGVNYAAAPQVHSVTLAMPLSQTITITTPAPSSAMYNSSFTVAATASSGLPVSITTSGGCSGSGSSSAMITMISGTTACAVMYNQYGNSNYSAATQVSSSTSATLSSQTITITTPAPSSAMYNSSFTVAATASSGLPVSITTLDGCTGSGTGSATVTVTGTPADCIVLYDQAGDGINYDAAPEANSITYRPSTVRDDIDGDGKADILFLNNSTGGTQYWKDAVKANAVYPGSYDNVNYSYAGSGDFNGDQKADLLFTRASNNGTLIWSGAVKTSATYPGTGAAGFSVAAICDTNGDGRDDIVWYNTATGGTQIWLDAIKANVTYPGSQNTAYTIVACADFDGDGKADLFWRNSTTGADEIWNGGSKATKVYPGANTNLAMAIVGAGDTNGDGLADVVWYTPSTGGITIWPGAVKSSATYPGTNATAFTPAMIGDYNGDGIADLLWVNAATNGTQIWPSFIKANVTYPGTYLAGFNVQK